MSAAAPLNVPVRRDRFPVALQGPKYRTGPLRRLSREYTMMQGRIYNAVKRILAVMLSVAMLAVQACFLPSGGSSTKPEYRYSQPGYEYNQPQYSQQQYGEYGQYPAYRYAPVPAHPQNEYSALGQPFARDGQSASQHALCDAYGNNCIVCDADTDQCRRQPSNR